MILRIILMSVVVICGIAALLAKKLAKNASEEKVFNFKLIMFCVMSASALFMILADKL